MIILIHVAIALASIAYSSYLLINPSRAKLNKSYALVALTLTSGTYLAVSTQTHLVEACMTGLVYTGFVAVASRLAHRKLARAKAGNSKN